jgi:nitrogen fixation/metabolism regulation signal transduction histidine kinase
MVYKRFSISVVLQLVLILAMLFAIAFLLFKLDRSQYIYTFIVLISLLSFQVYFLLRFITRTNHELAKFIDAIKQEDYSLKYPEIKAKNSVAELHQSFNTILEAFRQVKIEREIQFNFLQLIIENIEVGILAINEKEEIVLMNTAAEKLLGVHKSKSWRQLKLKAAFFCEEMDSIFSGGKKLIEMKKGDGILTLSIEVIRTTLLDQPHKLITLNNINKEMEQKELDAWIKLIRVLNHEIMNSTTPISSLTETIIMLLEDKKAGPKPLAELDQEVITDVIGSVKTIQKRSEGLYNFVNEYRKLTKVPPPKIEQQNVKELFEELATLMQPSLSENNICFSVNVQPEDLVIPMDPNLVEQVMINLIKNAIEAMSNTRDPSITVKAGSVSDSPYISVTDNGPGIEPGLMQEVFVPFFSTREQGSGIGLSLSRQIMHLHRGSILLESVPGVSTTFTLNF